MAEKGFGVKKISFVQPSGSPTLTSPNNINLNAVNVAISTDVSIGATCTAYEFRGAIASWEIGNDGNDHYSFKGPGLDGGTRFDPDINLVRGQKYIFHNRSSGHPFRIQSTPNGSAGTQYNIGVTNNDGAAPTDIVFDVPQDAPNILFYQCTAHPDMGGKFIIGNIPSINEYALASPDRVIDVSDAGKIVRMTNNVSGGGITVPQNALLPGQEVTLVNDANGVVNVSALSGVQFIELLPNNNGGNIVTSLTMYTLSMLKLLCVATDRYYVYGHAGINL